MSRGDHREPTLRDDIDRRCLLITVENFFSLGFLFNDPPEKVAIDSFLWRLRLNSIDTANHPEFAGREVEIEFNLRKSRRLSEWSELSLGEKGHCNEK